MRVFFTGVMQDTTEILVFSWYSNENDKTVDLRFT